MADTDRQALLTHYWSPIRALLDTDGVEDICVDAFDRVYYASRGQFFPTDCRWKSEPEFRAALNVIATAVNGVEMSDAEPLLDARLPDGSRVAASIPPLTSNAVATIRVARPVHYSLAELGETMFPADLAAWLVAAMTARTNLVMCGSVGSAKTTLMRALASLTLDDRIFVIEDTAELRLPMQRGLALECAARGSASVPMTKALAFALRSRPDRLYVGEIRTAEALSTYLDGLDAGFRGALVTMHASSAIDCLGRMETMLARAGQLSSIEAYRLMVRRCIDAVLYCALCPDGVRRIVEVVALKDGRPVPLWSWSQTDRVWDHDAEAFKAWFGGV